MKLKLKDKLLLFLSTLLVLVVGVGLLALGCQFSGVTFSAQGENFFTWQRIVVLAAGLLSVLAAIFLFTLPHKMRYNKHDFVVQQTDNGELRIAVKAIENLVQKCIDMHEEIHVVSMSISNGRDGVTIDLRISLANNISIPLAVASLQKQIKQYLIVSSGIDVREVRVSVETADDGGVGESPYLVESSMAEKQEIAKASKDKKKTLHQRIFEHEEEAAIVPEKPAQQKEEVNERMTEELFAEQEEAQPAQEEKADAQETQEEAAEPVETPEVIQEPTETEGETK